MEHPFAIGTVVVPTIDPSKWDIDRDYTSACEFFITQSITEEMVSFANGRSVCTIVDVSPGGYKLDGGRYGVLWLPEWLSVVSAPWQPKEHTEEVGPYAGRVIITMDREIAEAVAIGIGKLSTDALDYYYNSEVKNVGVHLWKAGLATLARGDICYMPQDPSYPTIIDIPNPNA